MGLYSLRQADPSVKLGALLFLLVLGYSYGFAFLMVRHWSGLTPSRVAATYTPPAMDSAAMPAQSRATDAPLDLGHMPEERHVVDTDLLIQDSHIHIMIYAIVAALETLIILGLDWGAARRNAMIVAAFGFGALDFAGQWLMKAGIPGFAWLTIASGWGMATVYLILLVATVRRLRPSQTSRSFA